MFDFRGETGGGENYESRAVWHEPGREGLEKSWTLSGGRRDLKKRRWGSKRSTQTKEGILKVEAVKVDFRKAQEGC